MWNRGFCLRLSCRARRARAAPWVLRLRRRWAQLENFQLSWKKWIRRRRGPADGSMGAAHGRRIGDQLMRGGGPNPIGFRTKVGWRSCALSRRHSIALGVGVDECKVESRPVSRRATPVLIFTNIFFLFLFFFSHLFSVG